MCELVRSDPAAPVEIVEEIGDDEDFYMEVIDSLGTHHSLELRLLRVRNEKIGKMPKSRDHFDPFYFLQNIYGKNENLVIMDSNKDRQRTPPYLLMLRRSLRKTKL